jgi:3'-5' exoribonuclease
MPEPTLFAMKAPDAPDHIDLRTLENGQTARGCYAVRERELKRKKNGDPWLRLVLGDASGSVEAVRWDDPEPLFEVCKPGTIVSILGQYEVSERWGSKIKLTGLREAKEGEYDADRLAPSSPVPVADLEAGLRALLDEAIASAELAALLDEFFGEKSPLWAQFREAPAARGNHQAYRYGLLEHTLTVAQGVAAAALIFPAVDREIAVAGALLHDIGKLWGYTDDPLAIDLTDAGKLEGEIPLGYYAVRSKIEEMCALDPEDARALLHIILSHHGRHEWGSPVEPRTREAVLVHAIDNLGGRLGSFDRLERELPEGERWSGFDRAIGGSAYFREEKQS